MNCFRALRSGGVKSPRLQSHKQTRSSSQSNMQKKTTTRKPNRRTSRKCLSKWRSCRHCSSFVQWRSQKSSKAASVSSSCPRSLQGAVVCELADTRQLQALFQRFLSPLHGRQVLYLIASHTVVWVGLDGFLDAVQQAAALRHCHLQVLLGVG